MLKKYFSKDTVKTDKYKEDNNIKANKSQSINTNPVIMNYKFIDTFKKMLRKDQNNINRKAFNKAIKKLKKKPNTAKHVQQIDRKNESNNTNLRRGNQLNEPTSNLNKQNEGSPTSNAAQNAQLEPLSETTPRPRILENVRKIKKLWNSRPRNVKDLKVLVRKLFAALEKAVSIK